MGLAYGLRWLASTGPRVFWFDPIEDKVSDAAIDKKRQSWLLVAPIGMLAGLFLVRKLEDHFDVAA